MRAPWSRGPSTGRGDVPYRDQAQLNPIRRGQLQWENPKARFEDVGGVSSIVPTTTGPLGHL